MEFFLLYDKWSKHMFYYSNMFVFKVIGESGTCVGFTEYSYISTVDLIAAYVL